MRKTLEAITLAALALLVFVTGRALFGPNPLPDRIPINFDLSGHPVGMGLLYHAAAGPGSSHCPLPAGRGGGAVSLLLSITPGGSPAKTGSICETLALSMNTWLRAELICLFAWLQTAAIHAARHPGEDLAAGSAMVPVSIVAVFGTILWHFVAMRRAARA